MPTSNSVRFDRQHYLIQFGGRWTVNTEVQVDLCNGTSEWFTPEMWQNVKETLTVPFKDRFESNSESHDLDFVRTDNLLISYKFHRHQKCHKKDTILSSISKDTIKRGAPRETYGRFKPCYLRNEKLVITVSKRWEEPRESSNQKNRTVTEPAVISNYFKKAQKSNLTRDSGRGDNEHFQILDENPSMLISDEGNQAGINIDESFHTKVSKYQRRKRPMKSVVTKNNDDVDEGEEQNDTRDFRVSRQRFSTTKNTQKLCVPTECNKDSEKESVVDEKSETDKTHDNQKVPPGRKKMKTKSLKNTVGKQKESDIIVIPDDVAGKTISKKTSVIKSKKKSAVQTQRSSGRMSKRADESILELAACDDSNNENLLSETSSKASKGLNEKSRKKAFPEDEEVHPREKNVTPSLPEDTSDADEFVQFPAYNTKSKGKKRKQQKITLPSKQKRRKKELTGKRKGSSSSTGSHISLEELIRNKENDQAYSEMVEERIATPKMPSMDDTIDLEEYGKVSLANISGVSDLSNEQLRDIVRSLQDDLNKITNGTVYCERHKLFNKGGKTRESLNMRMSFGPFSEEQGDIVSDVLKENFCKGRLKYLDYALKVLLPEALVMVYQKIRDCSKEEALRVFSR